MAWTKEQENAAANLLALEYGYPRGYALEMLLKLKRGTFRFDDRDDPQEDIINEVYERLGYE